MYIHLYNQVTAFTTIFSSETARFLLMSFCIAQQLPLVNEAWGRTHRDCWWWSWLLLRSNCSKMWKFCGEAVRRGWCLNVWPLFWGNEHLDKFWLLSTGSQWAAAIELLRVMQAAEHLGQKGPIILGHDCRSSLFSIDQHHVFRAFVTFINHSYCILASIYSK